MNVNVDMLRQQIEFLDKYPWREGFVPEEVEGVLNLLDTILDKEDAQ